MYLTTMHLVTITRNGIKFIRKIKIIPDAALLKENKCRKSLCDSDAM